MKYEERKRISVPLQGIVIHEISQVSFDDRFAECKLILDIRGLGSASAHTE